MKISLKNVKYAAFASEETSCFEATIYVDGKRAGSARNDGRGGSTFIEPRTLEQQLNDYAKTLPHIVTDWKDPNDPTKLFEYAQSAESLIDDLLLEWQLRRDMARLLKTRIVYTKPGTADLFQTKSLKPARMAELMAELKQSGSKTMSNWGADTVLNLISEEEAFALYCRWAKR